ncbi:MAG: MBL fold metallo-hydrolase [Clostridia bacterium]|nr:MBL fold metallo-hydrolase [Clostridia bacterium]
MPGKSKGKGAGAGKGKSRSTPSKSSRQKKKIRKKQGDKLLTAVAFIAVIAIAVIALANMGGFGNTSVSLPEKIATPTGATKSSVPPTTFAETDSLLRFDFIDVGQGDSTLITTPGGEYILVDTGTSIETRLIKHLEASGVDEIDYLILTHPHNDHIGGAASVLAKFDVKCVIMPDAATNTTLFDKFYRAIAREKKNGCKVYSAEPGDRYEIDGCTLSILAPFECDEEELNNSSVVMKLSYKGYDAMFSGDAERIVEDSLLLYGDDLDCELYKVAHHGSDTSSTADFVRAVSPDVSVISCGVDNSYGHPNAEIVKRLGDNGSAVYVTADIGTVTVLTDGVGYSVLSDR